MEFIAKIIEITALVLMVFVGFSFLYESFIEKSYFPDDLVISKNITRPVGIIVSTAGVIAIVVRLVTYH